MRLKYSSITDLIALLAIIMTLAFKDQTMLCRVVQMVFVATSALKNLHIRSDRKIRVSEVSYPLWIIFLLGYSIMSALWATSVSEAVKYWISLVQVALIGCAIVVNIKTHRDLEKYLCYYLIGSAVLIIRVVLLTPVSTWGMERITIEGYHVNGIANVATFAAIIVFCFLMDEKHKSRKWIHLAMFFMNIFIIAVSASKKNIIILPIVLLIVLMMFQKNIIDFLKTAFRVCIIGAIVLLLAARYIDVFQYTIDRMSSFFSTADSGGLDASSAHRLYLIQTAVSVFLKNPVLGCGLSNFKLHNSLDLYAHNNFFELAASLGIIGLVLYYYIYFKIILVIKRYWHIQVKGYSILSLAIIFAFILLEFTQVTYYLEYTHILLALLCGLYRNAFKWRKMDCE